mmetsp:Transcript_22874/g.79503  ORF Transcript_22874/g.79503 Transcript_22874/m.79503 type:complete len:224 (+) Transcript_22874:115-786(+)
MVLGGPPLDGPILVRAAQSARLGALRGLAALGGQRFLPAWRRWARSTARSWSAALWATIGSSSWCAGAARMSLRSPSSKRRLPPGTRGLTSGPAARGRFGRASSSASRRGRRVAGALRTWTPSTTCTLMLRMVVMYMPSHLLLSVTVQARSTTAPSVSSLDSSVSLDVQYCKTSPAWSADSFATKAQSLVLATLPFHSPVGMSRLYKTRAPRIKTRSSPIWTS